MKSIHEIANAPFRHQTQENMPFRAYLKAPGMSGSVLQAARKSMLHCQYAYEGPGKDATDSMLYGSAMHMMVFEPERALQDIAVWRDGRRYGKKWDEFNEIHAGKLIIKEDGPLGFLSLTEAVDPMLSNADVRHIVQEGVPELSLFASDHGMQVKGRIDWVSNTANAIVDLKLTNSVDQRQFFRNAYFPFGYGLKMTLYDRWFTAITGRHVDAVLLILVENSPPYDVSVVEIPRSALDMELETAFHLLKRVRRCLDNTQSGERWPGVAENQRVQIEYPAWAMEEVEPELEGAEEVLHV